MELETTERIEPAANRGIVPTYAWVILAVVMLAGVSAPINQFKVPPVMPVLMERFSLDLTSAGMLMSIFAITGLIVALPAGLFLQRFGLKVSGLVAVSCLLVGSIIGAISTTYDLLFVSRLVEGIGMGLIAVVGPAAISAWFPVERRGLPMGVWATWVSLGSLLIYNIAPPVEETAGWQSVWWFAAGLTCAAVLLFAIFFRLPPGEKRTHKASSSFNMDGIRKSFNRPGIWLLARGIWLLQFRHHWRDRYVLPHLSESHPGI